MALLRSGSTKTTLSMMQRRATSYEKYITLSSIFLILTSTIVIFTSVILIKWYFMSHLHFWHKYFVIGPYLMLSLGIYKFVVSMYGFFIADKKNRGLLVVFSLLLVIGFIGQLASVFLFWELRTEIQLGSIGGAQIQEDLMLYGSDPKVTKSWDEMQQHLSCCGGLNWQSGYNDYRNTPIGWNNSVPDSCCFNGPTPGCARNVFIKGQPSNTIFVQGCIQILQKWMRMDVEPMIGVYTAAGVAIALAEIIAVVLSSAYVAQITRRHQTEDILWYSVNGKDKEFDDYDSFQRHHNDVSSCNDTEV